MVESFEKLVVSIETVSPQSFLFLFSPFFIQLFNEARALESQGNMAAANRLYNKVTKISPRVSATKLLLTPNNAMIPPSSILTYSYIIHTQWISLVYLRMEQSWQHSSGDG